MNGLTPRQQRLWERLRRLKRVTSSDVHAANRELGAPKKTTARADLEALRRAGLLTPHGPTDHRWYQPTRGGV